MQMRVMIHFLKNTVFHLISIRERERERERREREREREKREREEERERERERERLEGAVKSRSHFSPKS